MSVTPKDIDDHIIDVVKQITRAAQTKNPQSTVPPLQKELKLYIVPRWNDILNYSPHFKATLEKKVNRRAYGGAIDPIQQTIEDIFLQKVSNWKWFAMQVTKHCPEVVEDLDLLKAKMKCARQKLTTTQTDNGGNGQDNQKPPEGEWSKPMRKSAMMAVLRIDSYKTFNTFAKSHGIRQAGNRQTFQIRLDKMDKKTRSKLEDK